MPKLTHMSCTCKQDLHAASYMFLGSRAVSKESGAIYASTSVSSLIMVAEQTTSGL